MDDARDPDPAIWRDGVHIQGTPIWCDALRAREVCFVSSGHAVPRARHGQLVATAETLALLGEHPGDTRLAVPYGRPFSLGDARLELVRSGHALGSASLLVDRAGHRVLYAGAVNPHGGGLGGQADLRPCDTLIIAAEYAAPGFVFAPLDRIVAEVATFALDVTSAGGTAVLLVTSPGKALDVASRLADRFAAALGPGQRTHSWFFGHRRIHDAAVRIRRALPGLPRIRRLSGRLAGSTAATSQSDTAGPSLARPPAGHVLFWPVSQRHDLPGNLPRSSRIALISGLARDHDAVAALDVDAAHAWSNQADRDELCAYVATSGARQVLATHRFAADLASAVRAPGRRAEVLGPPRQMRLF